MLSIPRSGTRFYLYFLKFVLGVPVRYLHFFHENVELIDGIIESEGVIVVPVRRYSQLVESYQKYPKIRDRLEAECVPIYNQFMPRLRARDKTHLMSIEKGDTTRSRFEALLRDLDLPMSQEVEDYIAAWEPVGSQYAEQDWKSDKVLASVGR